ncbi:MAG TPA: enoyl-CoA hydratase-related protein [Povalibacter sp.]|jgi:enoyl-CoA hydratase/carnithine racemase|nr:enoyl-CoA hydratase-related protein [Povalibacter sp.]
MTSHIRVHAEDGILRITFDRAEKKNAFTNAMYAAMSDALLKAESDPQIRVVMFDAEGDTFTAGNDIADFAAIAAGKLRRDELNVHRFLELLARAQKPYIAAVQGLAVGIGTTMLLHCDLVYVAEDARLSTPFVNLALVPEAASSLLMPARLGHARAFAMFALGEAVDGRTAAALGLANAAVPAADVRAHAIAVAKSLAQRPAGAVQATKRLMRDAQLLADVMTRESDVFAERLRTAEASEAFSAFAERRAPDFSRIAGR